ncbi:MAG TPA: hypothetical protein VEK07_09195 [Polyangiaceae bacterium]|nr:hypothetical protein [Polyangiaceae bacterium]
MLGLGANGEIAGHSPNRRERGSVRIRGGRVLEVRLGRLVHVGEMQSLATEIRAALRDIGRGAVIATDARFASPVLSEVGRVWSNTLREANAVIVCSAFLLDPSNTMFNLQLERILRCAGHPARQCFTNLEEVHEWIGAVLSDAEQQALYPLLALDP